MRRGCRAGRAHVESVALASLAGQWAAVGGFVSSAGSSSALVITVAVAVVTAIGWLRRDRAIVSRCVRRRGVSCRVAVLLTVAAASTLHAERAVAPPTDGDHVYMLLAGRPRTEEALRIDGRVVSVRVRSGASTRIVVEAARAGAGPTRPVHGRVALYVRHGAHTILVGERLRFTSALRRIENFGNFGEPDWAAWNARRGVFVTAFAWSVDAIERHRGAPGPRAAIRLALRAAIGEGRSRALVTALVTGDRRDLAPDVVEAVRAAGLAHVLAISGLHVGMVAGATLWAVRSILLRTSTARGGVDIFRPAVLASAVSMCAYAIVSTGGVSVARATVMGLAALWPLITGRRRRPFRGLAWAVLAVNATAPAALAEPGYQLSFAAAAAILVWTVRSRAGDGRLPRVLSVPAAALAVSCVAWAVTTPIVAMHFQRVSWVAPLANLLAAGPVAATVLLGLAGAVACAVAAPLAAPCFTLSSFAAGLVISVAESLSALPFAESAVPALSPLLAVVLAALVPGVLVSGRPRWLAALAVTALSISACAVHARYRDDRLDVVFASVGQGDATVVRLPGGRIAVVDGGGPGRGRLVVGPLLRRMYVGRIDYLIITHVQSDHWGGVPDLASDFEIGELWHPGGDCRSRAFTSFVADLRRRGVTIVDVAAAWSARRATKRSGRSGWELAALWPRGPGSCSDNDRSVVVRVAFAGASVLLPGDLEASGEQGLIESAAAIDADVLKAPHHGSTTSSTPALLAAVAPRAAVVSAGLANGYGFPKPQLLQRYRDVGARVYRTDLDGAVRVILDADGVRMEAAKRR